MFREIKTEDLEKISGGECYNTMEVLHTFEKFALAVKNNYRIWLSNNNDASEETKRVKLDEIIWLAYCDLDKDKKAQIHYVKENNPNLWNNFINELLCGK